MLAIVPPDVEHDRDPLVPVAAGGGRPDQWWLPQRRRAGGSMGRRYSAAMGLLPSAGAMTAARDRLASLLSAVSSVGSFSARRMARPDDLRIEVRGVGQVEIPVLAGQAEQLCALARPARFGRREQTLLDPAVRDTFEVPKSRIKIDKRRWDRTLGPVLAGVATDLGLPGECWLEAEFHAMLVYGPGQFFAPHQDSEKSDAMIGTLVVMLAGDAKGGVLQVEHGGESVSYRSSKASLTFVAFYADCRHQVKPVTSGYRVVLTYNLLLRGDSTAVSCRQTDSGLVDALAEAVNEHFATPVAGRYGAPDREPPMRLVYLLDHEYTEHGLAWGRLKGLDASRAAAIACAAEAAGCEAVLALAEVHETWNAEEPWEPPRNRRHWSYDDEDEDDYAYGGGEHSPDDYTLVDLIDSEIHLTAWLDQPGRDPTPMTLSVSDSEVCASTPSKELTPYEAEYEGYMGNYGNTMDRWYRRAAVVLWPRSLAFAVRAQGSPIWALDTLAEQVKAGDLVGARERAGTLASFWTTVATSGQPRAFVAKALKVAQDLDEPGSAAMLLAPLRVEMFTKTHAAALGRIATTYGREWAAGMVDVWFGVDRPHSSGWGPDRGAWAQSLPSLCEPLHAGGKGGAAMSRMLVVAVWASLRQSMAAVLGQRRPSERERALTQVGPAVAAVLAATSVTADGQLRDQVLALLQQDDEGVLTAAMSALRAGAKLPAELRTGSGLDALAARCSVRLSARLDRPERAADDWSIELPRGCSCALCTTLGAFLSDPARRSFEWPLAEPKRRHVHVRIDESELPVRHETRRTGSPYTLVLTKTAALFDRERDQRRRDTTDLAWIKQTFSTGSRSRGSGARTRSTAIVDGRDVADENVTGMVGVQSGSGGVGRAGSK
jgi:hypothetical protein